jgi:hypothetical protein
MKNTSTVKTNQKKNQSGFSLLELSLSLSAIFILIGAVSIGRDVHRNAEYQRVSVEFAQAWNLAYENYVAHMGVVPGDSLSAPTGKVNGQLNRPLCDADLIQVFRQAGIELPSGRSETSPDRFVYQDSHGLPQEVQVCFNHVAWSEAGAVAGSFTQQNRNVMELRGVTPALAGVLDLQFDRTVDARFGQFREQFQAAQQDALSQAWSADEQSSIDGSPRGLDENQVAILSAYLKMSR